MSRTNRQSTVLSDLGRSIRNEPFFLVYDHKIWVEKGEVLEDEVLSWLKKRYADARKGKRYRVISYNHSNGFRYVDYILLAEQRRRNENGIRIDPPSRPPKSPI